MSIDFHICDKILVINNFQGEKIDFRPWLQRFLLTYVKTRLVARWDAMVAGACGGGSSYSRQNIKREEGSGGQAEPSKSPLMA